MPGGISLGEERNHASPASPSRRWLLSVIIPAYNAANTLGEQLDALKAQEYDGDWGIIVIDNGSADNTTKVVQDYQRLMSNLRRVRATVRQSRSYARNVGAREVRGDAFLFCDADDIVAPGWVSAFAEALEKRDVVTGPLEMHVLNRPGFRKPYYCRPGLKEPPYLDFLAVAVGGNCAILRKAFEAIGGFSGEFVRQQDVDLSWRLQLHGYSVQESSAAVVYYRFPKTLRAIWKQSVECGECQVNLFRHFAAYGMPRPSARQVLGRYKRLIRRLPRLWNTEWYKRAAWLRELGFYWGRLRGSLRYRTLFL